MLNSEGMAGGFRFRWLVAMPFNRGLNWRAGMSGSGAMNLLLRSLAVGTLLTAATSFAADGFEGQVTMNMITKGKSQEMDLTMKGQMERMDMNAGGQAMGMIFDMNKREVTILMHEQHMYMVRPIPDVTKMAEKKSVESTAELEKTGKTETILGYKCQQVLVKDKGTITELWLAEGLGAFMGLGGGGNPMGGRGGAAAAAKWEQVLKGTSGFPLRVISRDANGKESFRMEATRVTPGPQPDSEFAPPAGYQKFAMPNFGG
ncbi:MAG: hypothetical protein JWQ62_1957 [Lacunisphaera sp.]|nr:hypothetical protein [Lacunisphaera sp.]